AAIGVIIIAKQFPVAVGLKAEGEPLHLLAGIPDQVLHMNPQIALIGGVSLLLLFGLPLVRNQYVRLVPAPMGVVLVALPLGLLFDLAHDHYYTFAGQEYKVGESFLVAVPGDMRDWITTPDFAGLAHPFAWKWVLMFALIGSLESLLSAKAIDVIDPYRRKT